MSENTTQTDPVFTRNEAKHRFEAQVEGQVAGFVTYVHTDGVFDLQHTIVEKAFEGRGIAGGLVRHVLDGIRQSGEKVIPTCPYVKSWIEKHPDYADLVA